MVRISIADVAISPDAGTPDLVARMTARAR